MSRAQREPIGKLEQRSIPIIPVTTHICRWICCLPRALSSMNSTGASLGRGVGKISLWMFPTLFVSRINGFKQITNSLNKLPLVTQKSNYIMGNCSTLSPASALTSQCWSQFLWVPALNVPGQRGVGCPPPECQGKSSHLEEALGERPRTPQ